ncbi:MAG: hypothetical protein PWQ55_584 [Chloroflexota bacterium]|nr:hypothetical protein [Chloroflexota bacterium]
MPYPSSFEVSAGDATLASQYNALRSDALFLGRAGIDAVTLAALLERYETRLKIGRLSTDQLRITASTTEPVSLLIAGYMVQAVANVDLALDKRPGGTENTYYVFANRADGSTTFTLTVSISSTEGENQRRIGRFFWDGTEIVRDSVRTELSVQIKSLLAYVEPQICEGRLSVSTGVSVPSADVSASSVVFFTPHTGNRIALYVPGYGWRLYTFSELSLDLSSLPANANADIWLYDNAGSLALAYTTWSNDTLRATAIVRQDGIYCKSGALNYRYLGTVHASAAGTICDTKEKRFVWNYYNRVIRPMYRHETTESWTYSVRAWRPWNNSEDNRVEFVVGVDEAQVNLHFQAATNDTSAIIRSVGIGLDSVVLPSSDAVWSCFSVAERASAQSTYTGYPGLGFHFLQLLETGYGSPAITYYGSYTVNGVEMDHSGAVGSLVG